MADVLTIGEVSRRSGVAASALRYENLETDVRRFLNSHAIHNIPDLPRAKAGLMSDNLEPRDFFSNEQLLRINEVFAEEFDAFGYSRLA